jgi:DNA topoisomerase I
MKLVIVESPKKCDTIGRYLGADYKVMASQGHIRDLSTKGPGGLGIDVDNEFAPDFVVTPSKKNIVKQLKAASNKAEEVILATDPDREGEAISWHLAQVLDLDVATTKRLQFHEITETAILAALEEPKTIDMNLVNSQETRRMYDRIIGFKLSSLLQKKMGSKSAGRVQSVTLRMICDNDAEIKAFKPEEYWTIDVDLVLEGKKISVSLDKIDGKTAEVKSQGEAEEIVKRIGKTMDVSSVVSTKKYVPSKLPFTTSTMQQEAFNRYKFSTSRTQSIAQRLYEGLDINGEHVGLITYMRTDSTRLSPEFYEKHAKPFILETYGAQYLGHLKEAKNSASAQDAHEAIRPTGTHRTPDIVEKFVEADEAKLYRLIYDRALASVMADRLEEQTTALFSTNGLTFKATGTHTLFKGYEIIYGQFEDDDTKILPAIANGEHYLVDKVDSEQKFTKAPARYSEAKVVKMMEEKGIGRPSTYASTIKTLETRGYVTSKSGILTPTEIGLRTTLVLKKYFPDIVSTEYTANMETKLDEIEDGKESRLEAMADFYDPFIKKFTEVQQIMYKDPAQPTGELCPKCGAPLVIKKSRYGSFVACSNYPKCDYIKKPEKPAPVLTGENCPVCGMPLVERKDRRGQTFIGCSGYPKCHYIKGAENRLEKSGRVAYTEKDYVKKCPSCKDGYLVVKHGRKVNFLGCTNFPKCHYHEWLEKKDDKKE